MRSAVVGLLLVSTFVAGCDPLEIEAPDEARVVLEGPEGASVRLVTSDHVLRGVSQDGQGVVDLVEADTSIVPLPFSRRYSIQPREGQYNFYVQAAAPDSQSITMRMQVLIDGEEWYDEEWDVGERPHDFLYLR